jgi:uncharacterized protein (UPF0264 family)
MKTREDINKEIEAHTGRSAFHVLDVLDMDCVGTRGVGCECDRCHYAQDTHLKRLLKAFRQAQ